MVFLRELLERIIDPLWGSYCEIFKYNLRPKLTNYVGPNLIKKLAYEGDIILCHLHMPTFLSNLALHN